MRILIELGGPSRIVDVRGWKEGTTLRQLVKALGFTSKNKDELYLDGISLPVSITLDELALLEGSKLSQELEDPCQRIPHWNVAIGGGVQTRPALPVPVHRSLVIGRAPQADIVLPSQSASWKHCTIELAGNGVLLRDADSTNGTLVNGKPVPQEGILITAAQTVIAGGSVLYLRPELNEPLAPPLGSSGKVTQTGTTTFIRPARPHHPPTAALATSARATSALAPSATATTSAQPVAPTWLGRQLRKITNSAHQQEQVNQKLEQFRQQLEHATTAERLRRQELYPDPETVMRWPKLPSTLMWRASSAAQDFLRLHLGVGDEPWRPELEPDPETGLDPRMATLLEENVLAAAPVTVELGDGGLIGIVGKRADTLALARSLIIQAAVHCGPADLTLGLLCDAGRDNDWDWMSWLPHTQITGGDIETRWMSHQEPNSSGLLHCLLERQKFSALPNTLVVWDLQNSVPQMDQLPRKISGIVLAEAAEQLPDSCTAIVRVGPDAAATLNIPGEQVAEREVIIAGVSATDAASCARHLSHFDDPELAPAEFPIVQQFCLLELLGAPECTVETIFRLWDSSLRHPHLSAVGHQGPFQLEITSADPHLLVSGNPTETTEFLSMMMTGLAAHQDPSTLNLLLMDFQDGSALAMCRKLPHVVGTITGRGMLQEKQLLQQSLQKVETELTRRQKLLAATGNASETQPRLVLVINQLPLLEKDFPQALASLTRIIKEGPACGVHVILATQHMAGSLYKTLRATTQRQIGLQGNTICLIPDQPDKPTSQSTTLHSNSPTLVVLTERAPEIPQAQVNFQEIGMFGPPQPKPRHQPSPRQLGELDCLIQAIVVAAQQAGSPQPQLLW